VESEPSPKSTGAFARSHFNIVDARKSGSKIKPVCLEGGESETSWRERENDASDQVSMWGRGRKAGSIVCRVLSLITSAHSFISPKPSKS